LILRSAWRAKVLRAQRLRQSIELSHFAAVQFFRYWLILLQKSKIVRR